MYLEKEDGTFLITGHTSWSVMQLPLCELEEGPNVILKIEFSLFLASFSKLRPPARGDSRCMQEVRSLGPRSRKAVHFNPVFDTV